MPWLYVQSTGNLYRPDGSLCGQGYSGHGDGRDNPLLQEVRDVGPIPVGMYVLGEVSTEKGPLTIRLTPEEFTDTLGRSGFLIHGDNINHDASLGCIVIGHECRHELTASADEEIKVIARPVAEVVT
jgi:hypothetical protein